MTWIDWCIWADIPPTALPLPLHDAAKMLMRWCCWCADATESGSGSARGPFYGILLQFPILGELRVNISREIISQSLPLCYCFYTLLFHTKAAHTKHLKTLYFVLTFICDHLLKCLLLIFVSCSEYCWAAVDCQFEFLSLASFIISDNPVPQRLKKYELYYFENWN